MAHRARILGKLTAWTGALALATLNATCDGTSSVTIGSDSGPTTGLDAATHRPVDVPAPPSPVQIIVEPSDDADALYESMSAATESIHMTMYLLSDQRFIDLLISQRGSGLDVKIVLNQAFPGLSEDNASSYGQLVAADVPAHWAPPAFTYPSGLAHEKCVIVDGKAAWIMTMNLDYSAPMDNREYLALDTDAADVAEAEALFEADYAGVPYAASGGLVVAPYDATDMLLALIRSATSTLDIEDEEFSDYMIADAVAAAAAKGIATRLVLSDDAPTTAQTSAVSQIAAAGARVVVTRSPYIHAKAIVVDGSSVFVGSENLTTGSLEYNRELGLITSETTSVAKVEATIMTDFSAGAPQ
jgi:phosphatidylserine/phosphatidylglycerophosphate/cardiolipin synthase-like enzyme